MSKTPKQAANQSGSKSTLIWIVVAIVAIVAAYLGGQYYGKRLPAMKEQVSSEQFESATSSLDEDSVQAALVAAEQAEEAADSDEPAPVVESDGSFE